MYYGETSFCLWIHRVVLFQEGLDLERLLQHRIDHRNVGIAVFEILLDNGVVRAARDQMIHRLADQDLRNLDADLLIDLLVVLHALVDLLPAANAAAPARRSVRRHRSQNVDGMICRHAEPS